jgi:hypothetical protein
MADHYPFRKAGCGEVKARLRADVVVVGGLVDEWKSENLFKLRPEDEIRNLEPR